MKKSLRGEPIELMPGSLTFLLYIVNLQAEISDTESLFQRHAKVAHDCVLSLPAAFLFKYSQKKTKKQSMIRSLQPQITAPDPKPPELFIRGGVDIMSTLLLVPESVQCPQTLLLHHRTRGRGKCFERLAAPF